MPGPDYRGLKPDEYLIRIELPNRLHRLLVEHPWDKLVLAHGCYGKKCTFCDVNLDYVGRFEPAHVEHLVAQIKNVVAQTGRTGFHFVDEAAPPALLKQLVRAASCQTTRGVRLGADEHVIGAVSVDVSERDGAARVVERDLAHPRHVRVGQRALVMSGP